MSSSTIYPEDNEGQTMYTTEQQLEMVSAELAQAKEIIEILGALDHLQKIALCKVLKGEQPVINTAGMNISGAPEIVEFYLDDEGELDMRPAQ
jgi:hypothetical protein